MAAYLTFLRDNAPWLLAGVILAFSSSYGQTFFISIFGGEIMEAFGLSDGEWGLTYTIGTTISAAIMVQAGALTDRYRTRALAVVVMLGLALACLAMATVNAPLLLIGVILALRLFGQGMMSHLAVVSMARWFVAGRGKALAIAAMGFALGTAFLPMLIAALLPYFHWRTLWVGSALAVLVTLPVILLLLRSERTPQSVAESNESAGMGGRHWTRGQMLRHPLFWLLVPALLGPPAWGTALFFQQVHIAEVKGWPLVSYVGLFPLIMAVTVTTTFATGWAIDRWGAGRLLAFYMLPFAISFAVVGEAVALSTAAIGLMIFGFGQGLQAALPSAFWAEFYGTRHIGAIKAAAGAIMVFGSAIGPGVSGWLIDLGIDFPAQCRAYAVYFLAAAVTTAYGVSTARRASAQAA